ncbi:MAG: hypothetical protein LBG19_11075 [Prevotellaceae bacterium]|jgi:hypothetical protein|nr:hypothetical protein [Prevotellaceae bacterium]
MKKIVLIAALLFSINALYGQRTIETRLCFSDSTKFAFSAEWQYLSTDIYLFNGNKFNKVINDLNATNGKRKKRGLAEERLEYLYITAQLINVKFFGESNITYPLYNFRINKDKENKYETYVSDNIESIRIIDNLPLYSASDKIDAKIDVQAITQNDRDNILSFIGAQLQGLAKLVNPTNAVLSLVGELGSFIESNSKKKEYKFSSTIRLFEQKNFDTRLHSLRVYALVSQNSPPIRLNDQNLKSFLDTCTTTELTRPMFEKLIGYQLYPLIVVANYKSLYRMQSISGDEITFANIDRRKLNIENNHRNKLISEETYRQEKDFIDFLTVFANFKGKLELYTLNARMGNADAAMNALGTTVQHYNSILDEYQRIQFKYKDNASFQNIFKSEYASIVDFASFYFESDHNLRAAKQMVATMRKLNMDGMPKAVKEKEEALSDLRFIDNLTADFRQKAKEGQYINTLIKDLEVNLLGQNFNADIMALAGYPATTDKAEPLMQLREKAANTYCVLCKQEALKAVKEYGDRLEIRYKAQARHKLDSTIRQTEPKLLLYSEQIRMATDNLENLYPDKEDAHYQLFNRKTLEIKRDIDDLSDYLIFDINGKSSDIINGLAEKIEQFALTISRGLEELRNYDSRLFEPIVKINPPDSTVNKDIPTTMH